MIMEPYFLTCLKENLDIKQRLNHHYSLRAFARDIDVHPSTLSAVLKKNRALPFKCAKSVIRKLSLSPKEETLFLESLLKTKTKLDDIDISASEERFMLDESHYKVIAEWEHFAVLELFDTQNFNASNIEIAKKLGISESRAEIVLNHLIVSGLVKHCSNGKLVPTHGNVRTTEDIQNQAIHQGHKEALELGLKKLEDVVLDLRDYSELVIALDINRISEAKTIIREFRQKMSALLRDGEKKDVYQLAIQFYPLTETQNKKVIKK